MCSDYFGEQNLTLDTSRSVCGQGTRNQQACYVSQSLIQFLLAAKKVVPFHTIYISVSIYFRKLFIISSIKDIMVWRGRHFFFRVGPDIRVTGLSGSGPANFFKGFRSIKSRRISDNRIIPFRSGQFSNDFMV
mgnify:CR=1 FL=1